MIPEGLLYTKSHEWIKRENDSVTVGITHYAQEQLTDIVFVELPETGRDVTAEEECGVIESCKIAAELYAPVSGTISAVNEALLQKPESINKDPYNEGWIVKIELSNPAELDELMDAAAYQAFLESES